MRFVLFWHFHYLHVTQWKVWDRISQKWVKESATHLATNNFGAQKGSEEMKKLTMICALCAVLVLPLSACGTMQGLGEDIVATGDAIRDAAIDTRKSGGTYVD